MTAPAFLGLFAASAINSRNLDVVRRWFHKLMHQFSQSSPLKWRMRSFRVPMSCMLCSAVSLWWQGPISIGWSSSGVMGWLMNGLFTFAYVSGWRGPNTIHPTEKNRFGVAFDAKRNAQFHLHESTSRVLHMEVASAAGKPITYSKSHVIYPYGPWCTSKVIDRPLWQVACDCVSIINPCPIQARTKSFGNAQSKISCNSLKCLFYIRLPTTNKWINVAPPSRHAIRQKEPDQIDLTWAYVHLRSTSFPVNICPCHRPPAPLHVHCVRARKTLLVSSPVQQLDSRKLVWINAFVAKASRKLCCNRSEPDNISAFVVIPLIFVFVRSYFWHSIFQSQSRIDLCPLSFRWMLAGLLFSCSAWLCNYTYWALHLLARWRLSPSNGVCLPSPTASEITR